MPEFLLNDLDVDTRLQGMRRSAVAQVMQTDGRQPACGNPFVEGLGDLGGVQGAAIGIGENATRVDPGTTPLQPLGDLPLPPCLDHRVSHGIHRDDAPARVALGRVRLDRPSQLH
nr:hypothetical protein [Micromonospora haikouensis]